MSVSHKEWFTIAEDDLNFAKVGLETGFYTQVCFLCQQASEKALKGLLIFKTEAYPRIHKLVDLLNLCAEQVPGITELEDEARILDQYYIPSRYPGGSFGNLPDGSPSEECAHDALEGAQKIYAYCLDQML